MYPPYLPFPPPYGPQGPYRYPPPNEAHRYVMDATIHYKTIKTSASLINIKITKTILLRICYNTDFKLKHFVIDHRHLFFPCTHCDSCSPTGSLVRRVGQALMGGPLEAPGEVGSTWSAPPSSSRTTWKSWTSWTTRMETRAGPVSQNKCSHYSIQFYLSGAKTIQLSQGTSQNPGPEPP